MRSIVNGCAMASSKDSKSVVAPIGWLRRARIFLYRWFFTSLAGMTFGDWWRLLRENDWSISPRFWPRAAFVTGTSLANSLSATIERVQDNRHLPAIEIPPPLFILGHWRSGTTYLHELLSLDPRLHGPTMIECLFPHSILTPGPMRYFLRLFLPTNRIVDEVALGPDQPFEDEFALAILTRLSPYFAWTFPRRAAEHEARLVLDDPMESARWKEALRLFAARLTARHQKAIVFKSPAHTARVRHVLRVFPDARFVLLHRDPYEVFASTKRLFLHGVDGLRLQMAPTSSVDDLILARYRRLHERFDADRLLLARTQLIEVSYRELDAYPLEAMQRLYATLGLGDFAQSRAAMERAIDLRRKFRKNVHSPLETSLRSRIATEWEPWFERWGYPT